MIPSYINEWVLWFNDIRVVAAVLVVVVLIGTFAALSDLIDMATADRKADREAHDLNCDCQ